jgi:predicted enzyme related to lactoylglutathione lyase
MPRVNYFEIYTDDPVAVQPCYRDVFGWTFQKFQGRFRNTEIVTVRNNQIAKVDVYFGWTIPHEAKPGGLVEDKT